MIKLINAIIDHNIDVVRDLLDSGIDPNTVIDDSMLRPIHFAAQENQVQIGELLISAGADIYARSYPGEETPLEIATLHKNEEFIKMLLKHIGKDGKGVNKKDLN